MLLLATQWAAAEMLRVDALRLEADAPWRRGDAAQEKEEGVFLLEWPLATQSPGAALQVALPRRATVLKADAAAFRENLRKKWTQQFGKGAEIREFDIGAQSWLVCRRATAAGDAIVFQLATVYGGRAYSLVAFASPLATGLPEPVYDLVKAVNFVSDARQWVATAVITPQPGREALQVLMQADVERLGANGLLTGYGVDYGEPPVTAVPRRPSRTRGAQLDWFIEGYNWHPGVLGDARQPFKLHGHLEASLPARAAGTLAVSLRLAAESAAAAQVEIQLLDVCAPGAEIDAALARLARGAHVPLERLLRERPAACSAAVEAVPGRVALTRPSQEVTETLVFSLPDAQPPAAGLSRVCIVALRPRLAGGAEDPGQALLRPLGLYFVYAPE
jgi:hypothetical protein